MAHLFFPFRCSDRERWRLDCTLAVVGVDLTSGNGFERFIYPNTGFFKKSRNIIQIVGTYSIPIGAGMKKKSQLLPFVTLSITLSYRTLLTRRLRSLKTPQKGSMRRTLVCANYRYTYQPAGWSNPQTWWFRITESALKMTNLKFDE